MTTDGNAMSGVRWLVIAEEAFVPADSGGRFESLNLLRAAAAAGVSLHVLVPGITAQEEQAHRAALPGVRIDRIPRRTGPASHASRTPYLFKSRPVPEALMPELRALHAAEPYTTVVAISFRTAHLAIAVARGLDLPAIVRPHNIESQYFRQLATGTRAPLNVPYLVEAWKLERAEEVIHRSPRIALFAEIAQGDVAPRAALTSTPVIHVPPFLPPAAPATRPERAPKAPGDGVVLFLGALDNANNVSGIRWFAGECWPRLHRARTGAELHVVGRRAPQPLVAELRAAAARVTVDAPEVASHLAAADVFVNPVRSGAGINIKMIEAMAAGLPVVTTSVGARGLHWQAGEHMLVADDPAAFREAVTLLLDEPSRRTELAAAGQRFVEGLDGVGQIRRLVSEVARLTARGSDRV